MREAICPHCRGHGGRIEIMAGAAVFVECEHCYQNNQLNNQLNNQRSEPMPSEMPESTESRAPGINPKYTSAIDALGVALDELENANLMRAFYAVRLVREDVLAYATGQPSCI